MIITKHFNFYTSDLSHGAAVEFALMSTTTARETAFEYSGVDKKRGTVFEILAGRVDVGASIEVRFDQPWSNQNALVKQTAKNRFSTTVAKNGVQNAAQLDFIPFA